MIQVGNYVRCPLDGEHPENPRDFFYGQVLSVNEIKNECTIRFYGVNGLWNFYERIPDIQRQISCVQRCPAVIGSKAIYQKKLGKIFACCEEGDEYFYYFGPNAEDVIKVSEKDLMISYNDGHADPLSQMFNYEFGNPAFFTNRVKAVMAIHDIERNLYGLSALAGAKIYLKPYQVRTVMRCVQTMPCRYMIADEVGLGKTIEAISVLMLYLKGHRDTKSAIVVPNSLVEQWKNELAFKFRLFEGANEDGNEIVFVKHSDLPSIADSAFDFVIIDEVHKLLSNQALYDSALSISNRVENILMLSATPVQKRGREYQRLLALIQPKKYSQMSEDDFGKMLELQTKVTRKIHEGYEAIEGVRTELISSKGEENDDVKDAFDDVIYSLKELAKILRDENFETLIKDVTFENFEASLKKAGMALSYASDVYQLEKSVIRNRRGSSTQTVNKRVVESYPYDLNTDFNNSESNVYQALSDLANGCDEQTFNSAILPLVRAFFSSAHAFAAELAKCKTLIAVPETMAKYSTKWLKEEEETLESIEDYLSDDPEEYASRPVNIVDYIDQECSDRKVLVFADNPETFKFYQNLFLRYFPKNECCFFSRAMSRDELDLNAYRFEHIDSYHIMLSDSTGGEGRNFQNAEVLVHIDIPWNANALEQRIGRLDRIGRRDDLPVISVTFQALDTIEDDLIKLWSDGVKIFRQAQSGIEIINEEIDRDILEALREDFSYGLKNVLPKLCKTIEGLEKTIQLERHFDVSEFEYSELNKTVNRSIEAFNKRETNWLALAMAWGDIVGFHRDKDERDKNLWTYYSSSFSVGSAKKTFFIPPDMKKVIDDKTNQMQNRIRALNGEKVKNFGLNYIQGSINRSVAIQNDYLHFFAPGDPIFDAITANAVGLYRGQSSAIIFKGRIDWTGVAFFWTIKIDEAKLYQLGLNKRLVEQFKGYVPLVWHLNYVPFTSSDPTSMDDVKSEFYTMLNKWGPLKAQGLASNLGSRDDGAIDRFKQAFPPRQWESRISEMFSEAKDEVLELLKPRIQEGLDKISAEIDRIVTSNKRAEAYFETSGEVEELEERKADILSVFETPVVELSAACFMVVKK